MKNFRFIDLFCGGGGSITGEIAALRDALQYAVEKYGKPGGPWNVPGDPGGWLDRVRKALEATE